MCKGRRLLKKSSISPEDEPERKSIISVTKIEELAKGEQPSVDSGAGIRHFKTIELNSTATVRQTSDDGELESLTDSPDDRSRGEGSSSLHASSFTPGTSPTSLSSLDEDSDSSSPSHVRSSGEGKQQRKAKHRQPGQMLPTIEDSSEEEELREEEELLREQEKQKGTGKSQRKTKKRYGHREGEKGPKLHQATSHQLRMHLPQKSYDKKQRWRNSADLPAQTSPQAWSQTQRALRFSQKRLLLSKKYISYQHQSHCTLQQMSSMLIVSPKEKRKHTLRSADEAYEEIILKVKSPTNDGKEHPPGKESLYGGMLIEDYAYESLVDDASYEQEPDKLFVSENQKKP